MIIESYKGFELKMEFGDRNKRIYFPSGTPRDLVEQVERFIESVVDLAQSAWEEDAKEELRQEYMEKIREALKENL